MNAGSGSYLRIVGTGAAQSIFLTYCKFNRKLRKHWACQLGRNYNLLWHVRDVTISTKFLRAALISVAPSQGPRYSLPVRLRHVQASSTCAPRSNPWSLRNLWSRLTNISLLAPGEGFGGLQNAASDRFHTFDSVRAALYSAARMAAAPREAPPSTPPPPPPPPPTYKVPDSFGETELPGALTVRLMGTPANGVPSRAPSGAQSAVIWVNGSNEVLVHLDSTQVRILDGMLLVSVDLETDQTGRTPLICSFALSASADATGLVATTDEYPRGDGLLASCWGQQLQQAVWSSILSLANDHADERDLSPRGLVATAGKLSLSAGPAIALTSAVKGAA